MLQSNFRQRSFKGQLLGRRKTNAFQILNWLAPQAGKDKLDFALWLTTRGGRDYLSRSGLLAVSRKKNDVLYAMLGQDGWILALFVFCPSKNLNGFFTQLAICLTTTHWRDRMFFLRCSSSQLTRKSVTTCCRSWYSSRSVQIMIAWF